MEPNVQAAVQVFQSHGFIDARHFLSLAKVPAEVIRQAQTISDHIREVNMILKGVYGSPEYGAWPEGAQLERTKMLAQRGVIL